VWRADETEFISASPIRPGGVLDTDPGLVEAWWATLGTSLRTLAAQTTTRMATSHTVLISQERVTGHHRESVSRLRRDHRDASGLWRTPTWCVQGFVNVPGTTAASCDFRGVVAGRSMLGCACGDIASGTVGLISDTVIAVCVRSATIFVVPHTQTGIMSCRPLVGVT
jgi:hypothetical protein